MPQTLPHITAQQARTANVRCTSKWIVQNPLRFFLIIVGCFLCSLLLHLNFSDLFADQPGLLRHSLVGSWIVGTMCAYIYADQLPPTEAKTDQKKYKPLLSSEARKLLGILMLWTLLIGLLGLCVYLRSGVIVWNTHGYDKDQQRTAIVTPDKHDFLQADDRQMLENNFTNLLFISADDIDRSGLSQQETVDMASRRKYFSDAGWQGYQAYVTAQKRRLISVQGNSPVPLKVKTEFVEGTRNYKSTSNSRSFSAEGIFLDGADTTLTRADTFKMKVTYAPAGVSGEVLIQSWEVQADNLK